MNEWQYFQIWAQIPYVGRQFAGWLWATMYSAIALKAALDSSAASGVGVRFEMLTKDGQALPGPETAFPGLPGIPGLGGLGIPGVSGRDVGFNPQPEPPARVYLVDRRTGQAVARVRVPQQHMGARL